MARTVKEVQHIGSVANNNNLVAMVGHTFIFNAAVKQVKKIMIR